MTKNATLQAALAKSVGKAAPASPPAPISAPRGAEGGGAAASRDGLVNVSSWQPPQFKQNLLMLKALGKGDVQALMAEALNDLFAKHNLPQVDTPKRPTRAA